MPTLNACRRRRWNRRHVMPRIGPRGAWSSRPPAHELHTAQSQIKQPHANRGGPITHFLAKRYRASHEGSVNNKIGKGSQAVLGRRQVVKPLSGDGAQDIAGIP